MQRNMQNNAIKMQYKAISRYHKVINILYTVLTIGQRIKHSARGN